MNVVLELCTPIEGQVLPKHQKGILIKGSPLAFTRIQNVVLLLTFVFVIKKISFFLYYGYELVQLVSNIRMNWDVKDGSGRKWQFYVVSPFVLSFCHCFCSQECSWKNSLLKARERTHKRSASHIHCTEWLQICLAFYLSLLSLLTWHLRRSRSRQLARDPETCRHSVLEVQYS